jgi:hypothetical protein
MTLSILKSITGFCGPKSGEPQEGCSVCSYRQCGKAGKKKFGCKEVDCEKCQWSTSIDINLKTYLKREKICVFQAHQPCKDDSITSVKIEPVFFRQPVRFSLESLVTDEMGRIQIGRASDIFSGKDIFGRNDLPRAIKADSDVIRFEVDRLASAAGLRYGDVVDGLSEGPDHKKFVPFKTAKEQLKEFIDQLKQKETDAGKLLLENEEGTKFIVNFVFESTCIFCRGKPQLFYH